MWAWIRKQQRSLNLEDIPEDITALCFEFYFHEHFDKIMPDTTLEKGNTIIRRGWAGTKRGKDWSEYRNWGATIIESTKKSICRWELKIVDMMQMPCYKGIVRVGVMRNKHNFDYILHSSMIVTMGSWRQYFEYHDQISIILDLYERTVSFLINGEDKGYVYKNIEVGEDVTYRLMVELNHSDDCVEILSFNQQIN